MSDLPPVPGAMTDGSKRRLSADSILDDFDNFEFIEDPEEILAHKLELEAIRDEIESADTPVVPPLAIGQYGAATAAVNRGGIQGPAPLPPLSRCRMNETTWIPLVALRHIYGPAGIRQIQMYGTCRSQGFDAAAWLKRQCWDVCEAGKDHRSFERKFVGAKPKSKAAVPKAKGSSKGSA